jgi:hypothetical protein
MRRGDRAERAADIRSGGELHLLSRVLVGRCRAEREPAGLLWTRPPFHYLIFFPRRQCQ